MRTAIEFDGTTYMVFSDSDVAFRVTRGAAVPGRKMWKTGERASVRVRAVVSAAGSSLPARCPECGGEVRAPK
jgi:hypothetical protein